MISFVPAATLNTERLVLTPLAVQDADEMVNVLSDERLYEFIGGAAPSLDALRKRYERQVEGSPDPHQVWLNWIVRLRAKRVPVGTLQAEIITGDHGRLAAQLAWTIGLPWQRQGFASESVTALVEWLGVAGVAEFRASIHPDNRASARVAERAGLSLTDAYSNGEQLWRRAL